MIKFVDNNTELIEEALKKGYEEIMGVTVAEGDPIKDFISWATYIVTTSNENINYTGNMNLVNYAKGGYLEAIGELVGVERIEESHATATIEYSFTKTFDEVVVIPKGHKIAAGSINFELEEEINMEIGRSSVQGKVSCSLAGTIGNGFKIGEINQVINDIPFLKEAKNITESDGGAVEEDDETLRERIKMKPCSYSTAGPVNAYKYYVFEAHSEIDDTEILSDSPGTVNIYALCKGGIPPTEEIKDKIRKKIDDDVRPFTDRVIVENITEHEYDVKVKWWANTDSEIEELTPKVKEACQNYTDWQKQKLGRDLNPNKLIQFLMELGLKRVEVISPAYHELSRKVVAKEVNVTINYQGEEDE